MFAGRYTTLAIIIIHFASVHSSLAKDAPDRNLRGMIEEESPHDEFTILCRVTEFETMMSINDDDDPYKVNEDGTTPFESIAETRCTPVKSYTEESPYDYPFDLPQEIYSENRDAIQRAELLVSITYAAVVDHSLIIHEELSEFTVIHDNELYRSLTNGRQLNSGVDENRILTVAIIRVSTLDAEPSTSLDDMQELFYSENGLNFKSQFEDCSYGKLQWALHEDGIIDLQMPVTLDDADRTAATLVTMLQYYWDDDLGHGNMSLLADKVILCLPPGTKNSWLAIAGVNHWRLQFNDKWCTSLSTAMHELGHSLGLNHAAEGTAGYGDVSGYMGQSSIFIDKPRKCFNGANSYRFQWYEDKTRRISDVSSPRFVSLAPIVDYGSTTYSVMINIHDEYFVLYNMQDSFNDGTKEKVNQVAVTKILESGSDSVAGLIVGESYVLPEYSITIEICSSGFNNRVRNISVHASGQSTACSSSNGSETNSVNVTTSSNIFTTP